MLESVKGTLLSVDHDVAVIDVGGLRFRLEIPDSTARSLGAVGSESTLLARLSFNANDGQFLLFGFSTEVERECFDIFTSISGIGPRKGLMILSQIEIAAFARAIVENDLPYLSRIKGVGKKTAERLVVELREKMVPYVSDAKPAVGAAPMPVAKNSQEAIQALMVLGCRQAVAEKAIGEAIKELGKDAGTEDLVRVGLRHR